MSAATASNDMEGPEEKLPPVPSPLLPLTTRMSYFLQLWAFKIGVSIGFSLMRLLKPSLATYRPTYTKNYPCRPHLQNRVFIPKSYKDGELLPLYLDIHGGGFAVCDPQFDDEFCTIFSNRFHLVLVSVNYTKAPAGAFPVPTRDVAAIARAAIEDPGLPIDRSRVAMGGFSAGGNLSLSAAQLPELRGRVRAVVPWYPVTDWVTRTQRKLETRPYRNPGDVDGLRWTGRLFNYGYCPAGTDLRDPLLSPSFAAREDLPEWVFTVAAEYDMLANEAKEMMFRLAGIEKPGGEEEYAFERKGYRWRLVRDVEHGFTHNQMETGEKEEKRVAERDKVMGEVGEWLFKGPFAK
jgi:acetyl esterase/lipase